MESTQRKQIDAATIAECDRAIERILSECDDELDVFVASTPRNGHFRHVAALVNYERARRLSLIDQLEEGHADCQDANAEKVAIWLYAAILVMSGGAVIILVRGLWWLGTKIF